MSLFSIPWLCLFLIQPTSQMVCVQYYVVKLNIFLYRTKIKHSYRKQSSSLLTRKSKKKDAPLIKLFFKTFIVPSLLASIFAFFLSAAMAATFSRASLPRNYLVRWALCFCDRDITIVPFFLSFGFFSRKSKKKVNFVLRRFFSGSWGSKLWRQLNMPDTFLKHKHIFQLSPEQKCFNPFPASFFITFLTAFFKRLTNCVFPNSAKNDALCQNITQFLGAWKIEMSKKTFPKV